MWLVQRGAVVSRRLRGAQGVIPRDWRDAAGSGSRGRALGYSSSSLHACITGDPRGAGSDTSLGSSDIGVVGLLLFCILIYIHSGLPLFDLT